MKFNHQSTAPVYGLLFATGLAWGQSTAADKAMANQLFDDAERLMAAGSEAQACPKFAESYRLDPQLGVLLHLGECFDKVGKTASAWSTFKDAIDIATQRRDAREAAIRVRAAELEPRLTRLTVIVGPNVPPTIEVRQNGELLGRAAWGSPIPVDPGTHKITASAVGYQDWSVSIEVHTASLVNEVTIPGLQPSLAPTTAAPPAATSSTTPSVSPAQPPPAMDETVRDYRLTRRTLGFVVGGLGVAGLGVGTVYGMLMKSKISDRDNANTCSATNSCTVQDASRVNQLTTDARADAKMATIGFAAGGAALVGGAVLVLTGLPKGTETARLIDVQPWVGVGTAGCAMGGFW